MDLIWVAYYFGGILLLSTIVSLCHCCFQAVFNLKYKTAVKKVIKKVATCEKSTAAKLSATPNSGESMISKDQHKARPRVTIFLTDTNGDIEVLQEGSTEIKAALLEARNPPSYEDLMPPSYDVAVSLEKALQI